MGADSGGLKPGDVITSIDDKQTAMFAVDMLHSLGHRRIACVSGWHSVGPSAERQLGYATAMTGADLEPVTVETNSRIDGGRQAVAELMAGAARRRTAGRAGGVPGNTGRALAG